MNVDSRGARGRTGAAGCAISPERRARGSRDDPDVVAATRPRYRERAAGTFVRHSKEPTPVPTPKTNRAPVRAKKADPADKIPGTFKDFIAKFPALGDAHETVARAVDVAGPLDAKTCSLVKIGLSIGAGLESATKSHVRRALKNGATPVEIEQAVLLAMNTCGFPRTVAAWSWARQQFDRET